MKTTINRILIDGKTTQYWNGLEWVDFDKHPFIVKPKYMNEKDFVDLMLPQYQELITE